MSSQPPQTKPLNKPRRAVRAVVSGLGDENAASSLAAAQAPRLAGKSSTTSLRVAGAAVGTAKSVLGATNGHAHGKASSISTVGQPRRALGDVSNATGPAGRVSSSPNSMLMHDNRSQPFYCTQANADRTSKDSLSLGVAGKPTTVVGTSRTRTSSVPLSQQAQTAPQPPSSTGTGLSRLRIGSGNVAVGGPSKARRVPSAVPAEPPVGGLKAPGGALRGAEWNGAWGGEGSNHHASGSNAASIGLGIEMNGHSLASMMSSPSMSNSLKQGHHLDLEDEDEETQALIDHENGGLYHDNLEIDEDEDDQEGEDEDEVMDPEDWVRNVDQEDEIESEKVLDLIRREFDEQVDYWDTTMVAEYSDEIFAYMSELEETCMPNPRYMDHQSEIEWPMRTTLIDWLLQVHMRYHMLPETLWIAINIIDRFLSNRVVSLVKFQLVGVTAMFIAAKYEEILAPSVEEFVFMTESGYTRDEILKGERIILQSLEFNISPYCSPYSWVRRISKADDYDLQTRTLSKFLMEVTLLDHRFLRAKPSMIAAIGMYLARRMLGGDWLDELIPFVLDGPQNESFIYYSNYTEPQLFVPTGFLLESIVAIDFDHKFVYKKYANKKFLKASIFARNWAKANALQEFNVDVPGSA
ncbi:BZ3500_MvSof-1268-A1-R1_Chr3-3g06542 [Microbotryum saponariae]|uniref:BZ3500_MvSof-1268-A1-R1_Chr3-3g06542 protein n=1 Tax=Microbotryum saponariae TaxID=289078 RepID=A0A2X0KV40_9BASI|nr:BZ3500_MvSof-1268-A1-R1_Chr3-3g06542 [Microbotryum saponariae]SDA04509.1 BZ3501_MvSof-1269-A2-R1_Chr3-2g06229 [Microbotryum saponariae]